MSDLLQDLDPAPALVRGDLVFLVIDPSDTPLDRKAAIEFLFANLPNLDAPVVFRSEVDAVAFWQVLANGGGVVLNVDTVNERVGIGTALPLGKVHIVVSAGTVPAISAATAMIIQNNASSGDDVNMTLLASNSGVSVSRYNFGDDLDEDVGGMLYRHDLNQLSLVVNASARIIMDALGNVALGTSAFPSAGSGKVLVFGDNAGDPTMAANTAGFYGKDVAGTVEAFAIDEAGNAAQLTSHPEDAPAAFYQSVDEDEIPAFIRKSFNIYIGKFEWFRSDLPLRQYETFDAYNTRHGFTPVDTGFMVQCDWTECQQAQVDRSEAEHAAWEVARDAAAAAEKPFDVPEPVIYIAQEPPQSLQDRGVTLKTGS